MNLEKGSTSMQLQAEKLQKHYQKMMAFHASHISKLQGEIDGLIALGSMKDADARLEYLRYHQMELAKVKGMLHLAAESNSMHDDAAQVLKVLHQTRFISTPLGPGFFCCAYIECQACI